MVIITAGTDGDDRYNRWFMLPADSGQDFVILKSRQKSVKIYFNPEKPPLGTPKLLMFM